MIIYIKIDAGCNETTPAISIHRCHEDVSIFKQQKKNTDKTHVWLNINHVVTKESRTDMESATFETLETTVTCSVLILGTSENPRNVTFLQQSR